MAIDLEHEIFVKRGDCSACRGTGRRDGDYERPERACGSCLGTGLELSRIDEQLVEGILRAVKRHNEYGWR